MVGIPLFLSCEYIIAHESEVTDTLKIYTAAHGHKTTNLVINMEDAPELWLAEDERTLASYGMGASRTNIPLESNRQLMLYCIEWTGRERSRGVFLQASSAFLSWLQPL